MTPLGVAHTAQWAYVKPNGCTIPHTEINRDEYVVFVHRLQKSLYIRTLIKQQPTGACMMESVWFYIQLYSP